MNTRILAVIAITVIMLVTIIFILSEGTGSRTISPTGSSNALPAVEVRGYQGNDLSSINDFRENSIRGPQYVNTSGYRLTVTGLTNTTDVYTYQDILSRYPNYTRRVTLFCVEGWDVTILWEGVLVRDLIRNAGIDPRANTVIFTAHDGYTTSFPLDYLMDNEILMAYKMNNVTLPTERGYPFQLVAQDKWGYKWIKWIENIQLTDDPEYRGYWEKRGYSNSGDLQRNFFSI
jgi:DMSO/TMAO reductase YedYZ molybdopterin-dependent catalytic subunit